MPELSTIIARSYLAADATYNNDDTLGDTALSVVVASSTKYAIEFIAHGSTANKNLAFDFGGTATITSFIGQWQSFREVLTDIGQVYGLRVSAAGTDFNMTGDDGSGENRVYTFRGSVEVNAGGTFLVRAAQTAAHASNTVLKKGSTLILTKMS